MPEYDLLLAEIREAIITVAVDRNTAALSAAAALARQFRQDAAADRAEIAAQLEQFLEGQPALKPTHRRAIADAALLLRH